MASKGLLIWEIWPKMTENWAKYAKIKLLTFWPKLSNHSQLILIGNDFKQLIISFIMSSSNFQSSAISATSTISAILAILYLRVSNIPFGLFFLIFPIVIGNNNLKKKMFWPDFGQKRPFLGPKLRFLSYGTSQH